MRGAMSPPSDWISDALFQLTLPMRGAMSDDNPNRARPIFQLTLPMRGAMIKSYSLSGSFEISTHAPHAGSDADTNPTGILKGDFNSRSPCGERSAIQVAPDSATYISTHAPHAGSDAANLYHAVSGGISTHAPHAGSDNQSRKRPAAYPKFQLTLPMRGAIGRGIPTFFIDTISTHAPHAGSDPRQPTIPEQRSISTHAPHAGSDPSRDSFRCAHVRFQLTLPMRGAMAKMK